MSKKSDSKKIKQEVNNENISENIQYINVFSKFHTQYISLLNILKQMISNLSEYNNISPQETLCLLQIYDLKFKNYTGDTGLQNLAKRTNNVADHLMFQLNNLARKNLVIISSNNITLTHDGEYIVNEIARQLSIPAAKEIENNINNIQKYIQKMI